MNSAHFTKKDKKLQYGADPLILASIAVVINMFRYRFGQGYFFSRRIWKLAVPRARRFGDVSGPIAHE